MFREWRRQYHTGYTRILFVKKPSAIDKMMLKTLVIFFLLAVCSAIPVDNSPAPVEGAGPALDPQGKDVKPDDLKADSTYWHSYYRYPYYRSNYYVPQSYYTPTYYSNYWSYW